MILDNLATMVANGFEAVDKRLDANTKEVSDIKHTLSEMKFKLTDLGAKFSKLEFKVDDVYEILSQFEEGDILDLQKRVKVLEKTVKTINKHLQ